MQLTLAFLEPSPPARPSPSQKLDAETRAEALNILARNRASLRDNQTNGDDR